MRASANIMTEKQELKKFIPVLTELVSNNIQFILVAGHAVSFWSEKYAHESVELQQKAPYVSKDLDLLSHSSELAQIKKIFPDTELLPWRRDMPLLAVLTTDDGQRIDFLRSLHGTTTEQIVSRSIPTSYNGVAIQVVDPFTLFQAKASNAANIDQANRNDIKQTAILAHVIPCYFRSALAKVKTSELKEREVIREMKLFMDIFQNTAIIKGCCLAEINLSSLFPLTELTSPDLEKCPRFLENTLTPWLATTEETLNDKS